MTDSISTLIKASKLRILYFLILMLGGFWISPLWPVFLVIWLGISLFWSYTKQDQVLSIFEKTIYLFSLFLYPILGTIIKIYIYLDKFPNTYFWVNRFEHSLWAMALVVLLLPFWKRLWVGLSIKDSNMNTLTLFIIVVGVICLFGNMVEFVEYTMRFMGNMQWKYDKYYPDTMFDMMSNVVGATLGFLIVMFAFRKTEKDRDNVISKS
jgi:hypothetical protein